MRRILASLVLVAITVSGWGCANAARLVCECRNTYVDVQRMFMGIDYPRGIPESGRQKFYGLPERIKNVSPCDD